MEQFRNIFQRTLMHIKKKFQLLDLPRISVYSTVNEFTVTIPLVKHIAYERADH